ncbi:MAG TPA: hypothetical protein VMH77_06440 [Steroidobacteraceae bacterium]|nr:hypothetical protein [Steroidobacteraceae bacterium]
MKSANGSRALEILAIAAIGEGIIALGNPAGHARLWSGGPGWWRDFMRSFERRPAMTRGLALAELGLGLWLARRVLKR